MQPCLYPGDLIIYRPIKKNHFLLKKGSIVIIRHPLKTKTILIKRVHQITANGVEVRGDNERDSTDSRQFGLINFNQLQGIVEHIIPTQSR